MPPRPAPPDWAAIRIRYEETDDPSADICADHHIASEDLARVAKREKWRRQMPRPFPPLRPTKTPTPVSRRERQSALIRDRVGDARSPTPPDDPPRAAKVAKVPPLDDADYDDGTPPQPAQKPPVRKRSNPATATARRKLLDRMVAAISLKLEQLERRMTQHLDSDDSGDAATATDHERETRAIGVLIDNLGKVTEMKTGLARTGKSDAATADLAGDADRWRRELAERLARIVGAGKS